MSQTDEKEITTEEKKDKNEVETVQKSEEKTEKKDEVKEEKKEKEEKIEEKKEERKEGKKEEEKEEKKDKEEEKKEEKEVEKVEEKKEEEKKEEEEEEKKEVKEKKEEEKKEEKKEKKEEVKKEEKVEEKKEEKEVKKVEEKEEEKVEEKKVEEKKEEKEVKEEKMKKDEKKEDKKVEKKEKKKDKKDEKKEEKKEKKEEKKEEKKKVEEKKDNKKKEEKKGKKEEKKDKKKEEKKENKKEEKKDEKKKEEKKDEKKKEEKKDEKKKEEKKEEKKKEEKKDDKKKVKKNEKKSPKKKVENKEEVKKEEKPKPKPKQQTTLKEGIRYVFRCKASGKNLRINKNKSVDGLGGEKEFAQFVVHIKDKEYNIIQLHNFHNKKKILRIEKNGKFNGKGKGKELCNFEIIEHGSGEFSLKSVKFGTYAEISQDGKTKNAKTTKTGSHPLHGRFIASEWKEKKEEPKEKKEVKAKKEKKEKKDKKEKKEIVITVEEKKKKVKKEKKEKKEEKKEEEKKEKVEEKKEEEKKKDEKKEDKKKEEEKKEEKKEDKKEEKKKEDKKKKDEKKDKKEKKKDEKKEDKKDEAEIEKKKDDHPVNVGKTNKEGETPIIYSPLLKGDNEKLSTEVFEGKKTIVESLEHFFSHDVKNRVYGIRRCSKQHIERNLVHDKEMITYKMTPITWINKEETLDLILHFAAGLQRFDKNLKAGSKCCIFMESCVEWIISAYANMWNNVTNVTCYANLGIDNLSKIIKECDIETIVVSGEQVQWIDEICKTECPSIKNVVYVGKIPNEDFAPCNVKIKSFYEVLVDGKKNPKKEFNEKPKADDLAFIMYTSGTTGDPKGVMMKHKQIVAACAGMKSQLEIFSTDVHVCYLPLSHVFELVIHHTCVLCGAAVGFGTPRTLLKKPGGAMEIGDLAAIKPTILMGVPKVWETIKKGVMLKADSYPTLVKKMFSGVLNKKINMLKKGKNENVIGEKAIFKKIRNMVGGNLRCLISGGAPLDADTQLFLQAVMGKDCIVLQGYALTETCSATTAQSTKCNINKTRNIGFPLTCSKLKLRDVKDMGYLTTNNPPRGEIMIGGESVTSGYFKKDELTKECFVDGWFASGDVGEWDKSDNSFKIIDRVKNLVKLSGGEYIAMENLESLYGGSPFVKPNGICIIADSMKNYIIAIVCVDTSYSKAWARERYSDSYNEIEDLIKDRKYLVAVRESFNKIHKENNKAPYEKIQKFYCCTDEWGPENGLTTSSFKLKRKALRKYYERVINRLYSDKEKPGEIAEIKETTGDKPKKSAYNVQVPKYFLKFRD